MVAKAITARYRRHLEEAAAFGDALSADSCVRVRSDFRRHAST